MVRERRQIVRAALLASVLSGAPSGVWALAHGRDPIADGLDATRAIGTLVPPGTPGLVRGALAHEAISLAVGATLGVTLPRERSVAWGAVAGLAIGWINLAVVARRRYPAIGALPLGPQLADNAAFGAVFAATVRARLDSPGARRPSPLSSRSSRGRVESAPSAPGGDDG